MTRFAVPEPLGARPGFRLYLHHAGATVPLEWVETVPDDVPLSPNGATAMDPFLRLTIVDVSATDLGMSIYLRRADGAEFVARRDPFSLDVFRRWESAGERKAFRADPDEERACMDAIRQTDTAAWIEWVGRDHVVLTPAKEAA